MQIKNACVFNKHFQFEPGDLFIDGERFCEQNPGGETIDAQGLMAIPGLVDIHTHGCVGYDFCDGTVEAFDAITAYEAQNGVTALVSASMTLPVEQLENIYKTYASYPSDKGAMLWGINMEGPFFSRGKKGAQNADYLILPDAALFHRLNEASGGRIRLACVAPELPGAIDYIVQISPEVTVSIAHTESDYDQAISAFSHGASHVTHLFNAMHPFSHRAPGVIGAAADSGATVELICDGIHIHPAAVRAAFKIFTDEKMVLISDSMMATGMPDGSYSLGGQQVTVTGSKCTLADGTIAGSATNLFECMRRAVGFGIPLESAIRMASYNPALVVGAESELGSLAPGRFANLVLMDKSLQIHSVYVKGKKIV